MIIDLVKDCPLYRIFKNFAKPLFEIFLGKCVTIGQFDKLLTIMAILLKKLKKRLYSNTWQTASAVILVVFASIGLSIWLFWRSLYLPELQNHAGYLASEIELIHNARQTFDDNPAVQAWVIEHTHLKLIDDPTDFPVVSKKAVVDNITDILAKEVGDKLGREVQVYFKFKPVPKLWVHDSAMPDLWLQEPVINYSRYSGSLLLLFMLGLPILTIITIFWLARTLNRPLKQLEQVASTYIQTGSANHLPTNVGSNEIRKVNTAFNRLFATLAQSQKERTIMLAGISHDLRTPLTRMRLTAEMLGDEFFKEGLIYDIEDMDAILGQFISFMKDGSDELPRPTNLDTICKEIMVQFDGTPFIYEGVATPVLVRPLSVKRLLVNLVNNAIRYAKPPIHLIVQILPANDDEPNDTLLLCVKDNGDGVDEDELERIMQPFERGETARTNNGSGLGLAIVERIAGLHNGKVEIINHPDGGLQVCVYMPLIKASIPTEPSAQ